MFTIDAHQHFWNYNPINHAWITDDMAILKKDFLPQHLEVLLQKNNVAGCVAVQADQTEKETDFLLQLASNNSFIKGVVGWVNLLAENIDEKLAYFNQFPMLKGFRHILQAEDPQFMLQPNFLNGISKLQQYNFTYDILIFPKHLQAAIQLVEQFPQQKFVVDHIAKPYIKLKDIEHWEINMLQLAAHPNVYCKISGMVTEADWNNWSALDLEPYLDVVVKAFGINRIMFGSDWPVCLVATSYEQWLFTIKKYFSSFSIEEQAQFFGLNAQQFYHLK
jgi:L-fuconolactonase